MTDYDQIAHQAETDLNTYQAKTGSARPQGLDDAGVNATAERKFDGAQVEYGDELSTNRGYNKRIPPSEGGVLDDRGRQTRGEHFEGEGGPGDKVSQSYRDQGGQNDQDVVSERVSQNDGLDSGNNVATQGQQASWANPFKGENYYAPESVPDSTSAQGWIAPESATQASREAQ
ncbi:hypothetical protein EDB81DRAFT_660161 [Dactylonectria macrodidyma]|uniref:Uncharacterized protein n=1 Tax=Dactylonectria macrodidyma TaxID=307937 RepID=A0A9P9IU34_9HYPO|nr:hypothetical protein EDB81DRAFT_660161 [Dactylonectria macrodidyma]